MAYQHLMFTEDQSSGSQHIHGSSQGSEVLLPFSDFHASIQYKHKHAGKRHIETTGINYKYVQWVSAWPACLSIHLVYTCCMEAREGIRLLETAVSYRWL